MEKGEIILYQPDNSVQLEVRVEHETIWLTQAQIALLYGVDRTVIVRHIGNIYKSNELDASSTCAKNAQVHFVRTSLPPVEGVFYDGQIFDAHVFVSNLIKTAKQRIILIDNYLDESVLVTLSKREVNVTAKIITKTISNQFQSDLNRYNSQYPSVDVEERGGIHDRFLIVDDTLYHLGASLKDLGKKLFAFSKMEMSPETILRAT
ncbi:MAG: DNA-binding protein [Bacteroidales bacterium]|nr:DNA-binding protein [Bacteroidales bacterium]